MRTKDLSRYEIYFLGIFKEVVFQEQWLLKYSSMFQLTSRESLLLEDLCKVNTGHL